MSLPPLEVRVEGDVAVAVMNFNRMSPELCTGVEETLEELERRQDVKAVVVIGRRHVFLGGADLRAVGDLRGRKDVQRFLEMPKALVRRVFTSEKFYVAAINGYCLGGGLEFALACHFRLLVGSGTAKRDDGLLGFPEITLGVTTALGGAFLLQALAGRQVALRLLCSGERLHPDQCKTLGIVDHVHEGDDFARFAVEWTRSIIAHSRTPPGILQRLIRTSSDRTQLATAQHEESCLFEESLLNGQAIDYVSSLHRQLVSKFARLTAPSKPPERGRPNDASH